MENTLLMVYISVSCGETGWIILLQGYSCVVYDIYVVKCVVCARCACIWHFPAESGECHTCLWWTIIHLCRSWWWWLADWAGDCKCYFIFCIAYVRITITFSIVWNQSKWRSHSTAAYRQEVITPYRKYVCCVQWHCFMQFAQHWLMEEWCVQSNRRIEFNAKLIINNNATTE